jgi:hypothetical protein
VSFKVPTAVTSTITGHDLNDSNNVYTLMQDEVYSLNLVYISL